MFRYADKWSRAARASLLLLAGCSAEALEDGFEGPEPEDRVAPEPSDASSLAQVVAAPPTPASRFGTVRGRVLDARDGTPVASGQVVASAACEGAGCGATPTAALAGGAFVFDAYAASPQRLLLTDDTAFTIQDPSNKFMPVSIAHGNLQYVSRSGQFVTELPVIYLCPVGSLDTDRDGICDLAETRYQTDPRLADSDGDALTDQDELYGHATGTAGRRYNIRQLGANPRHRDVFVEIDHVSKFRPSLNALNMVVAAFARAPLPNPDGPQGVNLHVFVDQPLTGAFDDDDLNPAWVDFDRIKSAHFNKARQFAFHYAVWGNLMDGSDQSGWARFIPTTDFMVTLGGAKTPGGTVMEQAGTFMHELGHDLGLKHGNTDDDNFKPHYLSVMNYSYQFTGFKRRVTLTSSATDVIDYGRIAIQAVNENALDEQTAFAPAGSTLESELELYVDPFICTNVVAGAVCAAGRYLKGNLSSKLDFDGNGIHATSPVQVDLNGDGMRTSLPATVSDWSRMVFHGGNVIGAASSVSGARTFNPPARCARPSTPVIIN